MKKNDNVRTERSALSSRRAGGSLRAEQAIVRHLGVELYQELRHRADTPQEPETTRKS